MYFRSINHCPAAPIDRDDPNVRTVSKKRSRKNEIAYGAAAIAGPQLSTVAALEISH
jgi:hypothetical protein